MLSVQHHQMYRCFYGGSGSDRELVTVVERERARRVSRRTWRTGLVPVSAPNHIVEGFSGGQVNPRSAAERELGVAVVCSSGDGRMTISRSATSCILRISMVRCVTGSRW
jgi:hypothetical protein